MSRANTANKVLFLLPYPLHSAPSQRFTVEQFLPLLDDAGFSYVLRPFMRVKTWNIVYREGSFVKKAWGILRSFAARAKTVVFEAPHYGCIFIHREASPLGPPIFEWYLKRILRKQIIYNFDDAIWIPNTSSQNKLAASLKAVWKVASICKWSAIVACGNDFLCDYARAHTHGKILRIPTVVDTNNRYNRLKQHRAGSVIIGWTGSHSTLKYLDDVIPALQQLEQETSFEFVVIADKRPDLSLKNWRFVPWNEETEIDDLLQLDIGLMPLTHDAWSEGKCGFKLIQYLALGIPAVASNVGVNAEILGEDSHEFLCESQAEWIVALRKLLQDATLRTQVGAIGAKRMQECYSIDSQRDAFLSLFPSD